MSSRSDSVQLRVLEALAAAQAGGGLCGALQWEALYQEWHTVACWATLPHRMAQKSVIPRISETRAIKYSQHSIVVYAFSHLGEFFLLVGCNVFQKRRRIAFHVSKESERNEWAWIPVNISSLGRLGKDESYSEKKDFLLRCFIHTF